MLASKDGKFFPLELKPHTSKTGYVFPAFNTIEIDNTVEFDVRHVFPECSERAIIDDKTTVPKVKTFFDLGEENKKYEDDMEAHSFLHPDKLPPACFQFGFASEYFGSECADICFDLADGSLEDLCFGDISENRAVKHYEEVLMNKDSYLPTAAMGNEVNKPLNDFIVQNMVGPPVRAVLDIGTGKGASISRLDRLARLSRNSFVHCIEPNNELMQLALTTPSSCPNVAFFNMTLEEFLALSSHKDFKYDLIIANNSVHLARDKYPNMLKDLRKRINPGGVFLGAFPNYDSLVFRPFYGHVSSGLVRSYCNENGQYMVTDISGVRRDEPVFPWWEFWQFDWTVTFNSGSVQSSSRKDGVIRSYATFRARPGLESDFRCEVGERTCGNYTFVRPTFRCASGRGFPVPVSVIGPSDPGLRTFFNHGKALTWGDFFSVRSFTHFVTPKVNGVPAHLRSLNGSYCLTMMGKDYRIDYPCHDPSFLCQVEVKISKKSFTIVLSENQSTPLFVNTFSCHYPDFLFLKDYISVCDVDRVVDMIISSSEGLVLCGPFSGVASERNVDNTSHIKWNPTIDVYGDNDSIVEVLLTGEVVRVRTDKVEPNSPEALRAVPFSMTPQSFISLLSLPIDLTSTNLPHRGVISYPFGDHNYFERNALVGAYMKGVYVSSPIRVPIALVPLVAHKWRDGLFKEVTGQTFKATF